MKAAKCILAISVLTMVLAGCSSENKVEYSDSDNRVPAIPEQKVRKDSKIEYNPSDFTYDFDNGKPVTIAGITFTPASQWEDLGPSDMRVATYKYGPLETDENPAEMSVFYFGRGQGGSIEANQQRWIKQMAMPDGRDPATAAIQYTMMVDGMPTHVLTLYGTYLEPVGGMMSGKTISRLDYRLVGVIVEAPEGNVFFKLTGPDFTARIMIEAFVPMIKLIKKV